MKDEEPLGDNCGPHCGTMMTGTVKVTKHCPHCHAERTDG